jgi:hypothetical protein
VFAALLEVVTTLFEVWTATGLLLDIHYVGGPALAIDTIGGPSVMEAYVHVLDECPPCPWIVDIVSAVAERSRWRLNSTALTKLVPMIPFLSTVCTPPEPRSVAVSLRDVDIVVGRFCPGEVLDN